MDTKALLRQHAALKQERATFDTLWREVSELVLPDHDFFGTQRTQGEKRTDKVFGSIPQLAAERHASAMVSLMVPSGTEWHGVGISGGDDDLNERDDVAQYFDDLTRAIFAERYAPGSGFGGQIFEVLMSGGVFGNSAMWIDEREGGGLIYKSLPLHEIYFGVDMWGRIDRLHREFQLSASAAYTKYGDKLPARIQVAAKDEPLKPFSFIHCVHPNLGRDRQYPSAKGMPFASIEMAVEGETVVKEGGYDSWPCPVYRYAVTPSEWYGRGWAVTVLPEIKSYMRARRSLLKQGEIAVEPPLLLADDGGLMGSGAGRGMAPKLTRGGLNYGGLSADGKPLIAPLMTGSRIEIGMEMLNEMARTINDAALVSLFQILAENPKMTAFEVAQRAQEKGQLVGPAVGRAQSDFLGPMIEREISILSMQGRLPEPPDVLRGREYKIEYRSPLNRLQRMEELQAVDVWLQGLAPLAQLKPEILDNLDADELARHRARVLGVPEKVLVDAEKRDTLRAERAKAAAVQNAVAAAPQIAGALKDAAQANQLARVA